MKKSPLRKHSKNPIAKLKKRLDIVFSKAMRKELFKKQVHSLGHIRCYTCDAVIYIDNTQVSHFISRIHHSLRWEPRNVRLCCKRCNIWLNGNLAEFALKLIDERGRQEVEWLRQEGNKIKNWSIKELEELIKFYEDKLN